MESKDIVYKSELNTKGKKNWLKTFVAFSNTNGGAIYAYYDDFGNFIGIPNDKEADKDKLRIVQLIRHHTSPIVDYEIENVYNADRTRVAFIFHIKKREKSITWLEMELDSSPEIYVRDEGMTVHPSIDEIQEMILKTNIYEYDKTVIGMKAYLSDFSLLDEAYRQANDNKPITEKLLKSFNLMNEDNKLTIAGYLFMDNSEYKNANLVCNVWPSITKGTDDYIDSKKYNNSILSLIDNAINYIKNVEYYFFGGKKVGLIREDIGSFSLVVLREALVNAFLHRDYKIDGNEICIDCYPDRLEISSPGAMLQAGYDRTIQRLESIVSQRRNQAICDVFVSCRMMEKKGSGFDKIIDDYKNLSEDYYPLYSTSRTTFTIILKNKKYKFNKIKVKNDIVNINANNPLLKTTDEILSTNESLSNVYHLIKYNPSISYNSLIQETGLSREGVKYNISKLKQLMLIEKPSINSDYGIIDDINRPCSIKSIDIDIRNSIVLWICNNLSHNINLDDGYNTFINKVPMQITKEQFFGALLLSGYEVEDLKMNLFKK